jgi:hypothetical protein
VSFPAGFSPFLFPSPCSVIERVAPDAFLMPVVIRHSLAETLLLRTKLTRILQRSLSRYFMYWTEETFAQL